MILYILILATLNVYRLTLLISKEHGPFDMFGWLRSKLGVKFDVYSNPYSTNQISEMVLCQYCLSVWVGLLVALFVWIGVDAGYSALVFHILLPLGLSGAVVFLFKWAGT